MFSLTSGHWDTFSVFLAVVFLKDVIHFLHMDEDGDEGKTWSQNTTIKKKKKISLKKDWPGISYYAGFIPSISKSPHDSHVDELFCYRESILEAAHVWLSAMPKDTTLSLLCSSFLLCVKSAFHMYTDILLKWGFKKNNKIPVFSSVFENFSFHTRQRIEHVKNDVTLRPAYSEVEKVKRRDGLYFRTSNLPSSTERSYRTG